MEAARFIPLAFALAISLSASSTETLNDINTARFFQPGWLRDGLDLVPDASNARSESQRTTSTSRVTQWLNWFNCFSGMWRRC